MGEQAGGGTRWVATIALILAVAGVVLGAYASLMARENAKTIQETSDARTGRIEKTTPAK